MSLLPFPIRDSIDDYYETDDIMDFLGQGTFASVYKAICRFDGEKVKQKDEVALKIINKKDLLTDKAVKDITNEAEVLRRVEHPNCVRLLDCFQTVNHAVIVMSYVSGKELFQALRENDFTEVCARSVMAQLLSALAYLHNVLRVVHRDIKPENVLVSPLPSGEYHVTLVDFGLARTFGRQSARRRLGAGTFQQMQPVQRLMALPPRSASLESLGDTDSPLLATPCGTLKYAAPETVYSISESKQLTTTRELLPRVDVYAAGTLMYVMLSGALPFSDFSNKSALYREMMDGPSFCGQRWENVSPQAIDVCRTLLVSDPNKRPRAEDVLRYQWFCAPANGEELRSPNSTSQRLPVDAIIGERETMIKAFAAMKPPETANRGHLDGEGEEVWQRQRALCGGGTGGNSGLPPGGRVHSVPFGVQNQRKSSQQKSYFDF